MMVIPKIMPLCLILAFAPCSAQPGKDELAKKIQRNKTLRTVKKMALETVKTGFNAGDGYGEVWIRDYNTFIELSANVYEHKELEENLLVFFRLQDANGGIVDGFIPKEKAVAVEGGYEYLNTPLEPRYSGHKNTVETDQETSLVQAVYKYIAKTGNTGFLNRRAGALTVAQRMEKAMQFLLDKRWAERFGLIYGATTADWGDVQHTHPWGVFITDDTKFCVDVYDNAMFVIALDNMMELLPDTKQKWQPIRDNIAKNTMSVLWDDENKKFIPHVYLDDSPYPESFDENRIFYHGGTAVAIEAGLLNQEQIKASLNKMIENVRESGAASIGLTLYPVYPDWAFENKGMAPYNYQNGGDWTWFGARMIQQLVRYGFAQEAYEQLLPMTDRVIENKGFYEWYTIDNKPKGSGTFRGSAGVLHKAIELLEEWSRENKR
ncbi:hypothetical protein [Maribacter sp. 2307ULW6-5]|uniref:hypothetical protein n=1 Tax=Maribacter sp. 2307ULW6-5 TaxID=3386275 RepID=UPI0039BD3B8F